MPLGVWVELASRMLSSRPLVCTMLSKSCEWSESSNCRLPCFQPTSGTDSSVDVPTPQSTTEQSQQTHAPCPAAHRSLVPAKDATSWDELLFEGAPAASGCTLFADDIVLQCRYGRKDKADKAWHLSRDDSQARRTCSGRRAWVLFNQTNTLSDSRDQARLHYFYSDTTG